MLTMNYAQQILNEPSVFQKISLLRQHANSILETNVSFEIKELPQRDAEVLETKFHPPKKGFSTAEGQARMLHDLASIELQAMELGLRTLSEFSQAPDQFREDLLKITLSEADHLEMCLIEIDRLGFQWGHWPIHLNLWKATSVEDSLLDRILIVHRYLEGSGLDAGDTLFRRLELIDTPSVKKAVHQITADEVGHVVFGSAWYRQICLNEGLNPGVDYFTRMDRLLKTLPRRFEPLAVELRKKAGFTDEELIYLQQIRSNLIKK